MQASESVDGDVVAVVGVVAHVGVAGAIEVAAVVAAVVDSRSVVVVDTAVGTVAADGTIAGGTVTTGCAIVEGASDCIRAAAFAQLYGDPAAPGAGLGLVAGRGRRSGCFGRGPRAACCSCPCRRCRASESGWAWCPC